MITILTAEKEEIDKVVSIHENAFTGFFLTSLGRPFLKLYYKSVSKHKDGILLGYFDENNILCGFCAATMNSNGFNKSLVKKNLLDFFLISAHILVTKPSSLIRLINNFTKKSSGIVDNGEYAELLSIAISTSSQGGGIGKKLLLELEEKLKDGKYSNLSLTTDYYNNEKTISFYKKMGYSTLYEFISYPNRKMYRMIKKIK